MENQNKTGKKYKLIRDGRPSEGLRQWAARLPVNKRSALLDFIFFDCGLIYGNVEYKPNNREFLECFVDAICADPDARKFIANLIKVQHTIRENLSQQERLELKNFDSNQDQETEENQENQEEE